MTRNDTLTEKINEIHHQELKKWLNECVKLNKAVPILEPQAILVIFKQQFDPNMDMNGFKSWLAYFHDLNKGIYSLRKINIILFQSN